VPLLGYVQPARLTRPLWQTRPRHPRPPRPPRSGRSAPAGAHRRDRTRRRRRTRARPETSVPHARHRDVSMWGMLMSRRRAKRREVWGLIHGTRAMSGRTPGRGEGAGYPRPRRPSGPANAGARVRGAPPVVRTRERGRSGPRRPGAQLSAGITSAASRSSCPASSTSGLSRISSAPASATFRMPAVHTSGGPARMCSVQPPRP
jgi:hypothetical protein